MRFRLLGPLEVWDGVAWSEVGPARQRTVLAVLLIEAGRVVRTDRLVDEIWGESPPRTATNALQGHVMRLRRLMGDSCPLVTTRQGYQLLAEDDDLDTSVFGRLVECGKRHLAQSRPYEGATRLAEALALWRGPALADVPGCPTVDTATQWLEQCRLNAAEDRIEAELSLGRHAEVVDELYRLVSEAPLRERLLAQLMLALVKCGRRGEALDAYHAGRSALMDDLGVLPGTPLLELEKEIRAGSGITTTAVRVVPAQLPADVSGFTGRTVYLEKLDKSLPTGSHLGIVTITGAAGAGKTALAVHWAHRVRHRFPDGQLYVNLRGYADGASSRPLDVLAGFLLALGVPAEDIPIDVDLAAALYRSKLADTRTLVVLDNAGDADQVRPLLPGGPGCMVVVTGRDQLRGLVALEGAHALTVEALPPTEAMTLLTRLLGDRVTAEPDSAAELASLCGCFPLTLRVVAANLSAHPQQLLADCVAMLRDGDRLGALEVAGDRRAGIRAAIGHSYAAQQESARQVFRMLGVAPGQDVTVAAVAALCAVPLDKAAALLDRLVVAHLVEEDVAGRYSMHDLLRLYAIERADAWERDLALDRLLSHYLASADAAARMLYPEKLRLPVPAHDPVSFEDHAQAMAWLDGERRNLVAAIRFAAGNGRRAIACLLADTLRGYFDIRMYTVDWLAVAQIGLNCAEPGDGRAQAAAQLSLALLAWKQSRHDQAVEHYTHALALTQSVGWLAGHGAALGNLGKVYADLGRLELAAEHHAQALAIDRRTGELTAQAIKLGNLGEVCLDLGRLDDAMSALTEALDLHRQVGSRGSESIVLRALALVHHERGDKAKAFELATEAVTVARGIGGQRQLVKALTVFAAIHHESGDDRQAAAANKEALDLAQERGDRCGEIEARIGLAAVHRITADAEQAIALARQAGARILEAKALTTLAAIQLDCGRPQEAAATARAAMAIHSETGHRLWLARTRALLDG
ncbi:DNA-binding SARP family transcriptional activator/tetratricopeptide (TPR) repeat protein [Kibdelosporangium banguiense]|uniref:DNA-binding SARP family transcriptional activator/tetratricopeptide (TPR) repeat protein n=1 Tax=Kibdelosporangium banguiense TaxID=1365924 RepID=A0ABS4U1F1_9PSEU|nr:BTAD domain-containing putative transcriptional regulator [Kibdelosporangium banguiense]MBP2330477.1 DNA-binding SARP family transcriptional activator/tetratricopeptide (TPR) repeat protein [Kibdelosporangium banguiense]